MDFEGLFVEVHKRLRMLYLGMIESLRSNFDKHVSLHDLKKTAAELMKEAFEIKDSSLDELVQLEVLILRLQFTL